MNQPVTAQNAMPQPGLPAILAGLRQGPMPQSGLAGLSMTDLLQGLQGQGQAVQSMSVPSVAQTSPWLRNTVGGQGARAVLPNGP